MKYISYDQIIAVLGLCVWFVFPLGMFISVMRQDRESLPPPAYNPKDEKDENLKIFTHKDMLYNDEVENIEAPSEISSEIIQDDEFNHPHPGIGSTHVHHIQ